MGLLDLDEYGQGILAGWRERPDHTVADENEVDQILDAVAHEARFWAHWVTTQDPINRQWTIYTPRGLLVIVNLYTGDPATYSLTYVGPEDGLGEPDDGLGGHEI